MSGSPPAHPFGKSRKPIECPTAAEVHQLLSHVSSLQHRRSRERDCLMIALMADCGLRLSELLGLLMGDLYTHNTVATQIVIKPENAKYGSGRTIPTTKRVQGYMSDWIHSKFNHWNDADMWAFRSPNKPSRPLSQRAVQLVVADHSQAALGRKLHPHQLRHHAATELMRVTNQRVVQQFLGHRSLSTTSIYTHPTMNDMASALDKLGK